jgi:hypothetical protein
MNLRWRTPEFVAGPLDQNTDYRFASITDGSLRIEHLELRVESVGNDDYLLSP